MGQKTKVSIEVAPTKDEIAYERLPDPEIGRLRFYVARLPTAANSKPHPVRYRWRDATQPGRRGDSSRTEYYPYPPTAQHFLPKLNYYHPLQQNIGRTCISERFQRRCQRCKSYYGPNSTTCRGAEVKQPLANIFWSVRSHIVIPSTSSK